MAHKSALIVDDSKTARRFLARVLERHRMRVATAASAEEALDFLTRDRPDVIFMDHMMPGMDGFEALRAIKRDPATASIPVMMYTSQSGELFVSRARALGAVGVLPKQIQPMEMSGLLESLELIPPAAGEADVPEIHGGGEPPVDARPGAGVTVPVDDDRLAEALDGLRRALRTDLEGMLREALEARGRGGVPNAAVVPRRRAAPGPAALLVVGLAGLCAVFFWLHLDSQQKWRRAAAQNAELMALVEARRADAAADTLGVSAALEAERAGLASRFADVLDTVQWTVNRAARYAPGEVPLDDARGALVTGLVRRLERIGFGGTVRLEVHTGEFCLVEGPDGGRQLAPPGMPLAECAAFGTPAPADGGRAALESVSFANLRAELADRRGISLRVANVGSRAPATAYPPASSGATAGDWNRVARINNAVYVELLPDAGAPALSRAEAPDR